MYSGVSKRLLIFLCICTFPFAQSEFECSAECKLEIVETIPEGMAPSEHKTTYESWVELIEMAENSIEIASYYWTLKDHESNNPPHPTSDKGQDILNRLIEVGQKPEIDLRIVKHINEQSFPNHDITDLINANAAEVRDLNVTRLIGSGILHTKMWIVDRKHLYLGSSNLDWRALTQVKEVGIMVKNCPCIAEDMGKTFDVYWELGGENTIVPEEWPESFESPFNFSNPSSVNSEGINYSTFVSSAPPQFCPQGRTSDLDAVFHVMDTAEEFIHIAVMDYFPLIMFDGPLRYWGDIDNYLRNAALRNIKVKLLMAKWQNTRASAKMFLSSLQSMNEAYPNVDIQVKMFQVPADEDQANIPFARVNHNKYVVTDKATHIGTSNWSGDYFVATGGVGFVAIPQNSTPISKDIRTNMAEIFDRDWNSIYAISIEEAFGDDDGTPTTPMPNKECKSAAEYLHIGNFQLIIVTVLILASNFFCVK